MSPESVSAGALLIPATGYIKPLSHYALLRLICHRARRLWSGQIIDQSMYSYLTTHQRVSLTHLCLYNVYLYISKGLVISRVTFHVRSLDKTWFGPNFCSGTSVEYSVNTRSNLFNVFESFNNILRPNHLRIRLLNCHLIFFYLTFGLLLGATWRWYAVITCR